MSRPYHDRTCPTLSAARGSDVSADQGAPMTSLTRAKAIASFRAVTRQQAIAKAADLTHEGWAGCLLLTAEGDVRDAIARCDLAPTPFGRGARAVLEKIAEEEGEVRA